MVKRTMLYVALAAAIFLSPGIQPVKVTADQHVAGAPKALTAINLLLLGKQGFDPELIARIRANIVLPPSLELVDAPSMQPVVDEYLNGEEGRQWAIVLGKAFFWDQGAGSDGQQACASCHFQAGADPRSKNQISPGLLNTKPGVDPKRFDFGGPNFQLSAADFPTSRDVDDVISSQGFFSTIFIELGLEGGDDICTIGPADTFEVGGTKVRRVEPRNAPTVVNAVLNARNFMDGRANNFFNGVDPHGRRTNLMNPVDPVTFAGAGIWTQETPGVLTKIQIEIPDSSLASQAVVPVLRDIEMACAGRTFPDVARKMLGRERALIDQRVHPDDSVLGQYVHITGFGIRQDYHELITRAFKNKYWNGGVVPGGSGLLQIEANFALFWGLAIQMYEATLFSNQTPFDSFARGDDRAMTLNQLKGLEVFLTKGQCVFCHGGQEFTNASVRLRTVEAMERMVLANDGVTPIKDRVAVYDGGFYNIGVTPTSADIGIGAAIGSLPPLVVGGPDRPIPLCYARQASVGPRVDQETNGIAIGDENFPDIAGSGEVVNGERVGCDGAFKTPTLRNIALTAPYFHNGSHGTLRQVMDSYGDNMRDRFATENIDNLAPLIQLISHTDEEGGFLVDFLNALTDRRVVLERAPFDHPELRVFNGHPDDHLSVVDRGDGLAVDDFMIIPAVGANGRVQAPPPFLGITQ